MCPLTEQHAFTPSSLRSSPACTSDAWPDVECRARTAPRARAPAAAGSCTQAAGAHAVRLRAAVLRPAAGGVTPALSHCTLQAVSDLILPVLHLVTRAQHRPGTDWQADKCRPSPAAEAQLCKLCSPTGSTRMTL